MNVAAASQYDDDDEGSVASSGGMSLTGDLSIHELVLRKKHLLLNAFELADYKKEGEVSVPVWADVMHKVLSLHINWENMVGVLVSEDCINRRRALPHPHLVAAKTVPRPMMRTLLALAATTSSATTITSITAASLTHLV